MKRGETGKKDQRLKQYTWPLEPDWSIRRWSHQLFARGFILLMIV